MAYLIPFSLHLFLYSLFSKFGKENGNKCSTSMGKSSLKLYPVTTRIASYTCQNTSENVSIH